jgi:cytidine deaminase
VERVDYSSLPRKDKDLIRKAANTRRRAAATYSNFLVGAAVRDENGAMHTGCNTENIAFTGPHAEEGAISMMIALGGSTVTAVAVVTTNGGPPCGNCRQHIWEFCEGNKEVPIYIVDTSGNTWKTTIGILLPYAFSFRKKSGK